MESIIGRIKELSEDIGRPLNLMEVCGTHTVAIFRHGIRSVIPDKIRLLSGPGCPVCVTSVADVEKAIRISEEKGVILTTFGDMMRVPGVKRTLTDARVEGADVRIVYSPVDALTLAKDNSDKTVVFFATGFETTSPSVAATLLMAEGEGVKNFYIHSVHKLVPPALNALVSMEGIDIDGFILPGHVSTIIGVVPYRFLCNDHNIASVIAGFGAEDILKGIQLLMEQISRDQYDVKVQYSDVVREEGNPKAMQILTDLFKEEDAHWRGIGVIPGSGLALRKEYEHRDALKLFDIDIADAGEPKACRCGDVLTGRILPTQCNLFGKVCTPEKPVGACMVSTEGSCAAYYKYGGTG